MICLDCRDGADYIWGFDFFDDEDREYVAACHATCTGCDCQHDWQAQMEGRSLVT